MIKILNLYAGIGGNRKLWSGDIKVTAIEYEPNIAKIYADFFPEDKIIITDAHQYLLEHFNEYDFIWSSPPCPTHSKIRKVFSNQNKPVFPDMKLYEEIIFLQYYFKGKWVVENVIGFYEPLIKPQELATHYFWANFDIGKLANESREHYGGVLALEKRKQFNLDNYSGIDKIKILRNCVEPEVGEHIFNCAFKQIQLKLV